MKKLLVFTLLTLGFTTVALGQEMAKNAIGLRLGDGDGFGAEISYQRAISESNRLEFDLGWRDEDHFDVFKITGLYQWLFPIDGGFNWYAGAGAGFGAYDTDRRWEVYHNDDGGVFGFIAGDIGIEYNFDIPLLLSLDFRPELGFNDIDDNVGFDIGLGIRYQF